MVNLIIDDKKIEVPDGTTVLRAAQGAGIHIPTLCDHQNLSPYGGCRLCLVEIDGVRALQPSCTLPASSNMVVHTDTERVRTARKFVLTLLFSERNHFCPFCQVSGGDCELQNSAYGEGMTHWPLQPNWQTYTVDASNPYYVLDNNRCILCRRCVRACAEMVGNFTLGFEERGANSYLVADFGVPLGESSCVSCGTCVQICPTGALIDRGSAYRGKETQVEHHPTVCVGCSVGCLVDVLTRDNNIVRIEGIWDDPHNNGVICKTGRFLPLEEKGERIVTPMLRHNGKLTAATWDQALDAITAEFNPLLQKNGDGLAAAISTRLPAESMYVFKSLFADKLGNHMVTSLEEGYSTAGASMLAAELGKPFEGKLAEINSSDCIVSFSVDLVNNHEVAGFFVKRSLPLGVNLITIDSEENPMDHLAKQILKTQKGSEADVIRGLSAAVVTQKLNKKPSNLDGKKVLAEAVHKTNISAESFNSAATIIASATHPVFIYGKRVAASDGNLTLKALVELAELTGVLTEERSGIIGTKGQANSLASAQFGLAKPFELNGEKAVYIALGDDQISPRWMKRLEKASFLVVQASYVSELTDKANVVLPVSNWNEEEGHYLSLDGRLQASVQSINPAEGVMSNTAALNTVAERLGITIDSDGWKDKMLLKISPVAVEG